MNKAISTNMLSPFLSDRRGFLSHLAGAGLGLLGLATVAEGRAAPAVSHPMAPRSPHFTPRAKRVLHIFANGGPSAMDTFDPKPALAKYAGQPLPAHYNTQNPTAGAMPSPFAFKRYGESGLACSELFADLAAAHADELCVIRSLYTDTPIHEASLRMMNTGSLVVPRPSLGSWVTWGLGTENRNLPGYVSLVPSGLPFIGEDNWQSSFLPNVFQGTYVATNREAGKPLIDNLVNPRLSRETQTRQMALVEQMNARHFERNADYAELMSGIHNYQTAFRMQVEATDAFDISKEPESVRKLYGDTPNGRQLLVARRLLERGVRFVQAWHGPGQPWDSHNDLEKSHRRLAKESSQGITALLTDLKSRGLLEDTLVVWGGEFGRTPLAQIEPGKAGNTGGRDHNPFGFTMWMAGGGVKGGTTYGATDDFGFKAVENRVHVHDLHATILHLLGFDHQRMTYHHAGRDFRLTDVHGHVIQDVLA